MQQLSAETPAPALRSLLTVVRGDPTDAELAALTVVVGALMRGGNEGSTRERPPVPRWAAKDQMMRPHLRPGPGAWRASAAPR